jgi:ABC-type sugar transport system, periplasmic component
VNRVRKWGLLAVAVLIGGLFGAFGDFGAFGAGEAASGAAEGARTTPNMDRDSFRADRYDSYLLRHDGAASPDRVITIPGVSFASAEGMEPSVVESIGGEQGPFLRTEESGSVTWTVDIPESGLYQLSMRYYPVEGKSSSIERQLLIDGETPFHEASSVLFPRLWTNGQEIARDNRGNDIRPRQIESPAWQEAWFEDAEGYYEEPYKLYFSQGKHTITLVSLREPVVIDALRLHQAEQPPEYAELRRRYEAAGYAPTHGHLIKVQGEDAVLKSSPTLYPITDRSSPATEPYHVSKIRINTIGGYNWRIPGQWLSWRVEVPEDGLYRIGIKFKQNTLRGVYSTRSLYIDGKLPFAEMKEIPFLYKNSWQMITLGEEEPYLFYLSKGTHELKLEVSLGRLAPLIREVESSVLELNDIYRKIIMITGTTPDPYRDYELEKQVRDMIGVFREQADRLEAVAEQLRRISGETSDKTAVLDKMVYQLRDMADRPETVPSRLSQFRVNVGGLGTWMLSVKEQPLEIDYLVVASPDVAMPKAEAPWWKRIWHELTSFIASFTEDYNSIGNVSDSGRTITVWVGTGRDQAQVLKTMIDDTFTPETGISVNLRLVNMSVLLPATLSGEGPDIAMQIGNDIPVNYGMRGAAVDLSTFPDFEQVAARFKESALVPYRFRGGVYGLPEQQVFPMLFYRKDILAELGLEVPQTWDDVYEMIPVLQKHNMQFALPLAQSVGVPVLEPNAAMAMLLYQMGGSFYYEDGKASALDSETAMRAFKMWTDFYTAYKLPVQFDFPTRFRTGEIPVGIADYTTYNYLTVSAPEIRGLWEFAPVPGIRQDDGTIRRDTASGGTAAVMLKHARDKEAAWRFLKWWTDKDTQVRFGREMEGLMGAAARYPTANVAAMGELPWPFREFRQLEAQWEWVRGVPEVPGGYFTGRHLDNAFRDVLNNNTNTRDALYDYVQEINKEIAIKRKEFHLDE